MEGFAKIARDLLHPYEVACLRDVHNVGMSERYAVSRAVLRLLLSSLTHSDCPTNLFADGCSGRPLPIPLDDASDLLFSVSHSSPLSCFAIVTESHGRCTGIGVDVERRRTVKDPLSTADFAFSTSERDCLREADPDMRNDLFLRIWTRKEAVVKCCGGSVAADMDHFSVPLDRSLGQRDIRPDGFSLAEDLRLADLDLGPGVHAAVCWSGDRAIPQPFFLGREHLEELRSDS